MMELAPVPLGHIAEVIMGQSPAGNTCCNIPIGVPLLNGPTEFGSRFPIPVQYTNDPKKICNLGDILFCVRGSTTGRMNIANTNFAIGRGLAAIRHKNGEKFQPYLRGLIENHLSELLRDVTGSTFPNLNKDQILNLKIIGLPLPLQQRISEILGALDDKIEVNRQMNQTLEQMAQALYKHYFVDEIDPENLPEGWKNGKLGEIYQTTSGGTPSRAKSDFYCGSINWVKSKELNGGFIWNTEETITDSGLKKSSAKILPIHSVLLAMYGATVGEIAVLSINATCNQAICALIPNNDYPYTFAYLFLEQNKQEVINQSVGSAQQNISQIIVQNLDLPIPPIKIVQEYHTRVIGVLDLIEQNVKENTILIETRDALLPKLISGELIPEDLHTIEHSL